MKKYANKSIVKNEETALMQAFGFTSKEELTNLLKDLFTYRQNIYAKFAELSETELVKDEVIEASQKILDSYSLANPTVWECWLLWINCNNGANLYCINQTQYTYEDCIILWMNLCLAQHLICWMEAE